VFQNWALRVFTPKRKEQKAGHATYMTEMINACTILVMKTKGKRPLRRSKWLEDNIIIDLK
jgi:predicted PhzF superfamily epimerase YddE/YHI9